MPAGTVNNVSGKSGTTRSVIAFAITILSAYLLGSYYAGASAHTGIKKPLLVLCIVIGALVFLFRWAKGFTGVNKPKMHLWMAIIACYICWVTSWDIMPYGGLHESSALEMLVNPVLLLQKMNDRYRYLIDNHYNSIFYRPYLLRIIYVAELALFAFLAKYMSRERLL